MINSKVDTGIARDGGTGTSVRGNSTAPGLGLCIFQGLEVRMGEAAAYHAGDVEEGGGEGWCEYRR